MTAVLSLVLASCIQEEPYAPGELDAESCFGVYFPTQSGVGDLQIEPNDPTTLTYLVRRTNSRGELRVPVTIKANYPIFSVDEVVFEDGSPVAEVVVHFPTAKIATTYECTLIIEGDEFVSKYSANPSHLSFSVTRVKWNDVIGPNGETTGRWRDGIFPEWFSVTYPNLERTITIQERDDMPGYYRTFDVYSVDYLGTMFNSNMSSICVSQHYTYIDATDPSKVWIPTFQTGAIFSPSYGMTSIGSYVAENEDFDPSIASVYGTLKDGVIEFPYGSLQMKLATLGWYPTNSAGLHRIILPGYRAKDYDMDVTAGVSDQYGNLPISVSFGADIAQVKLAVFKGSLTESAAAQKAQLIADNAGEEELGEVITAFMRKYFPEIIDYEFTASMEDKLDSIENRTNTTVGVISEFYKKFEAELDFALKDDKRVSRNSTLEVSDVKCEKCGSLMVYKNGKFGKFLACPNYPECKNTKTIDKDGKVTEQITQAPELAGFKCELCGSDMIVRSGKYGTFYACSNYPTCTFTKQKITDTGVLCPNCSSKIVARHGRGKMLFYSCEKYPECDFSTWDMPLTEKCPDCGGVLYFRKSRKSVICKSKNCNYKREEEMTVIE